VTRILAYAREFREGIAFSPGLSDPDEPAIAVRDLTGAIESWIDIGLPDAARLHKASKASPRVAVYTHKDPAQLVERLGGERIHRADALELYAIDRRLIGELAARLERRLAFGLSIIIRQASITSPRLCGGMFVAMPTAIPEEPLTRRFGYFAGSTAGSLSEPS